MDRHLGMAIPSGFAPRSRDERLRIARALLGLVPAGATTKPRPNDSASFDDGFADGFVAACAAVASGRGDPAPPNAPLVSILICTYNRAAWLRESIRSAQAQRWPCEIVVVDDGSSDETDATLATLTGIRCLRHETNRGKPAALELGMAACRGEAVLVLDDDDLLLPGAVALLARALFANEDRVAVFGDTLVFDDRTREITDWSCAIRLPGTMSRRAALTTIPAMPGATLIRMSAQLQCGSFEPTLVRGQDMDHFLRLAAIGPMEAVPLPVLLYRRHDGLRGSAGARWQKHRDPAEHRRRFLSYVQPIFRARWRQDRHEREEGFAWALGLAERELPALAMQELARWCEPFTPHEAWVRQRLGLRSPAQPSAPIPWLILDDGDTGALEALLRRLAPRTPVEVLLPRAHDGVGACQLFWPGTYRVERVLQPRNGWFYLRSSAAPQWSPPSVDGRWLPPVPLSEVPAALSAVAGWVLPERVRPVRGASQSAITRRCLATRNPSLAEALSAAADVVEALPDWWPARLTAAALCEQVGLTHEASKLRRYSAVSAVSAATFPGS